MLRNTDMKISEIAETVGFSDPFYFCRIFSKAYGAAPREYRKRFL
jgi:AraC-like DNA-binding protein